MTMRSTSQRNQVEPIAVSTTSPEDVPPPPYTPNDPSTPAAASVGEPLTNGASHTLPAQTSRLSLRGGYVSRRRPSERVDFPSAVVYFEERPLLGQQPSCVLQHAIPSVNDCTRENLPFPSPQAHYEERDVTESDWSTFVNYLLPESTATEKNVEVNSKPGLQTSDADHDVTLEQQQRAYAVIEEWNTYFFGPRGIRIHTASNPGASTSRRSLAAPSYVTNPPEDNTSNAAAAPSITHRSSSRSQPHAPYGVSIPSQPSAPYGKSPLAWAKCLLSKAAAAVPPPPQDRGHGERSGRGPRRGHHGRRHRSSCSSSSSSSDSSLSDSEDDRDRHSRRGGWAGRDRGLHRGHKRHHCEGRRRRSSSTSSSSSSSSSSESLDSFSSSDITMLSAQEVHKEIQAHTALPATVATLRSLKSALESQRSKKGHAESIDTSPALNFSTAKEAKAYYRNEKRQSRDELRAFVRSLKSQYRTQKHERRAFRYQKRDLKRAVKREARQLKRDFKQQRRNRRRTAKQAYREAKRQGKRTERCDGVLVQGEEDTGIYNEQRGQQTGVVGEEGETRRQEAEEYARKVEAKSRQMAAEISRLATGR